MYCIDQCFDMILAKCTCCFQLACFKMFQAYPSCAEFHQGSQGSEISRGWELPEQEAEGEEGEEGEEGGARCYPLLSVASAGAQRQ